MKSLLVTVTIFMLLAQLIAGNWYVRKCANRTGNCRSTCRVGEVQIQPATGICSQKKVCCILTSQNCGGEGVAPGGGDAAGGGGTAGGAEEAPATTAAPAESEGEAKGEA
ncbi:beta-defensin 126 [Dipodomys spectabilis]|uniref:beta-defensin 126 n=1 Tax=Dipodomys spectabilis TaxID=105255 RepID=UPI001C53D933|nr:beta-defensin 126 [Dipodomys spectabilis]